MCAKSVPLHDVRLMVLTGQDVDFAIWSGFECSIATLCACVPTMRPLLIYIIDSRPVSATITRLGSKSYVFRSRRSSTEKRLNSVQVTQQHPWKAIYGERSVDIRSVAHKEDEAEPVGQSELDDLRALTASRTGEDLAGWSDQPGIIVQTDLEISFDEAASRRASHNPV